MKYSERHLNPQLLEHLTTFFTILFIISIVLFISDANAQPANDNCASAINLTVGAPCTNGTNVAATTQLGEPLTPDCWLTAPSNTVWYKFATTTAGNYIISTDNGGTTDTEMKLYSSACGIYTLIGCSEDNGTTNTLAVVIQASLSASTTYWVSVDVYSTGTGTFCINVSQLSPPTNDCILNAIDITSLINPVSTTNPYDCNYSYTYNATAFSGDDPTQQVITSPVDPCGCNGTDLLLNPYAVHYDVWFKFTVSGLTPNAYLQLFPTLGANQSTILVMALYSGTPSCTCPSGNITGLTQIDCSAGEVLAVPPTNSYGGARDEAICSTPIHSRLDISGLPLGTYYVRVFDFNGGLNVGAFTLCAESIAPRPYTSDVCPASPNIGYMGIYYNRDVNATYTNLSNAGNHGNDYGTSHATICSASTANELLLGATPAGESRVGCAGPWVTYVGQVNNIMNITVIHSFIINACIPECIPTVVITFNNIVRDGTLGDAFQIQVMAPGNCTGSTQTIMNAIDTSGCIQLRSVGNAPLPSGQYYIVVDGQDGQLLTYDLTLTIDYPCDSVISCIPLPVELLIFNGESINGINHLKWATATETNNDHFEIQRSRNGREFTTISTMPGAGNSTAQHQYATADAISPLGISYYRLRQVDYDGHDSYSEIISVKNSYGSGLNIESYNNGTLYVNYKSGCNQNVLLRLIDMQGKLIHSEEISFTKGINQFTMNTPELGNGIYLLEALDQSMNSSKSRFVK
jgi:hypothetical protein